jgi:hypothetical protein
MVGCVGGGPQGGGADRRPVTDGRLDEAARPLGAESIAVAADGQHVAVMQKPVEGCVHERSSRTGALAYQVSIALRRSNLLVAKCMSQNCLV